MNLNRQLINLIGGLVTVLVLVAGVLLIGLPMYAGAKSADKEADDVARSNDTQQIVIDGLVAQAAKLDDLTTEVTGLRAQIAAEPRVDDVVALALAAASAEGATVKAVNATDSVPFAVRGGADATAPAPSPDPAAAEPAAAAEEVAADTTADAASSAPAAAAPAADETQQQVTVTLEMLAPSVDAATSIVDALRHGPRAVAITKATTSTDDDGVKLNVELLVFVNHS